MKDYYKNIYKLQDKVLNFSNNSFFYLTGGTAINRFYKEVRYSDDLDFFVNKANNYEFKENVQEIILELKNSKIDYRVITNSRDFIRIIVIESRFDPYYYKSEFLDLEEKIKNSKYQVKYFRYLINNIINGIEIRNYSQSGFRYLRVSDLDNNNGIIDKNIRFVNINIIPDKIKLHENCVILSRSGSLGLVKSYDSSMKNHILSSHIFKIVLKNEVIPKYIEIFIKLKFGQKQVLRYSNGGIIPEINQPAVKSIKIPLPPKQIQQQIIDIINSAYKIKKSKETEAKRLLNSIDDYILSELGITLPKEKNKKTFIVNSSEVLNSRFDPFYYKKEFLELEEKVKILTDKKLKDYILYIASGSTPDKKKEKEYYTDKKNGIPFLRVQNITEEGLILKDCKYINLKTHENLLQRTQVFEDDLLVTITGRIASSTVVPKGFKGNINQHSVVIKTANRKISEVLATFLNSAIGQKLALRRTTGGTRLALDYKALKSIPIIFNEKIVDFVKNIYSNKKRLQQEAKEELQKAKMEVEKIILGESNLNNTKG